MNLDYISIRKDVKLIIDSLDLSPIQKFYAMYLFSKIDYTCCMLSAKKEKDTFYRRRMEEWTNHTGFNNKTNKKLIDSLVNLGLIIRDDSYEVSKYSKGMKPTSLNFGKIVSVKGSDYMSSLQLEKHRNRQSMLFNEKYQWQKNNIIKLLEFNYDKTIELVEKLFKIKTTKETLEQDLQNLELEVPPIFTTAEKRKLTVEDFEKYSEMAKLIFKRTKILELINIEKTTVKLGCKSSRQYHVLSNASSDIKGLMQSKDSKKPYFVAVDIKNSQPFIFLCLCKKFNLEVEEDIKIHTITGNFYELVGSLWYNIDEKYIKENITKNKEVRSLVKRICYRDIFFSTNNIARENSKFYKAIKEKYPLFCEAIYKLSNTTNSDKVKKTLAGHLQDLEAEIVLPLAKKEKAFSIHDSILSVGCEGNEEITAIKDKLRKSFLKKYGYEPALSIDIISKREN